VHIPVLLYEVIKFLNLEPGKFIVDGTVNGGGHAEEILKPLGVRGNFLGIDWDQDVLIGTRERLGAKRNVRLVQGNYAELPKILKEQKMPLADGLLLDLGFSSEQLEWRGRGFSFMKDEPLRMTYDTTRPSAAEVLRQLSEQELTKIIYDFSNERFARRIAHAIKLAEREGKILTTGELAAVIEKAVPGNYEMRRLNPATRTFQALRIYVNDELGNLEKVLKSLTQIVAPGGRVVIISFHSLEDRLVKNNFKKLVQDKKAKLLTKKPITATREEIVENPRSRSAKLRALEII